MFIKCSTCFERHTTHHQELRNCNCSLWFYIRLWLPAAVKVEWELRSSDTAHHQELKNCNCSFWFYIRLWLPAAVKVEWELRSSDTPLIIRSSKTVTAASGFTYVCGCRPLSRPSGNCVPATHRSSSGAQKL